MYGWYGSKIFGTSKEGPSDVKNDMNLLLQTMGYESDIEQCKSFLMATLYIPRGKGCNARALHHESF